MGWLCLVVPIDKVQYETATRSPLRVMVCVRAWLAWQGAPGQGCRRSSPQGSRAINPGLGVLLSPPRNSMTSTTT